MYAYFCKASWKTRLLTTLAPKPPKFGWYVIACPNTCNIQNNTKLFLFSSHQYPFSYIYPQDLSNNFASIYAGIVLIGILGVYIQLQRYRACKHPDLHTLILSVAHLFKFFSSHVPAYKEQIKVRKKSAQLKFYKEWVRKHKHLHHNINIDLFRRFSANSKHKEVNQLTIDDLSGNRWSSQSFYTMSTFIIVFFSMLS